MIGIIGGSGLYKLPEISSFQKEVVSTPYGECSAGFLIGTFNRQEIVFLPRHGERHQFLPHEINYRANIFAFKKLGVKQILSISAVGSLKEELAPGKFVLMNQYFDATKGKRVSSFMQDGLTGHISTAQPVCPIWSQYILDMAIQTIPDIAHARTYVCVEGPRLGTKAESLFYKNAGFDVVGMTNVPEAFLATEAQICYAALGVVTDYDCWREDPKEHVTGQAVLAQYQKSLTKLTALLHAICGDSYDANHFEASPSRQAFKNGVISVRAKLNAKNASIYDQLIL